VCGDSNDSRPRTELPTCAGRFRVFVAREFDSPNIVTHIPRKRMCVTMLDSYSTEVEFAMCCCEFDSPDSITQKFDAQKRQWRVESFFATI
jgi:hypothetical protein